MYSTAYDARPPCVRNQRAKRDIDIPQWRRLRTIEKGELELWICRILHDHRHFAALRLFSS